MSRGFADRQGVWTGLALGVVLVWSVCFVIIEAGAGEAPMLLYGERVGALAWVGAGATIVGVALVGWPGRKGLTDEQRGERKR